jgi:hypothetical protein
LSVSSLLVVFPTSWRGIWLVTWKKGSSHQRLPYNDIVEEALCFGWIDSRPRSLGTDRSAILVTPAVDGTFIWTPSHDQRPHSFSTALLRSLVMGGWVARSRAWPARPLVAPAEFVPLPAVGRPG